VGRPKTAAPSLQGWGSLQKGRAVFRREDRLAPTHWSDGGGASGRGGASLGAGG